MEYSKPIGSFKDLAVMAGAGGHEGPSVDPENGAHPVESESEPETGDVAAGAGAGGHEGIVHEPHAQPNSPAALESDDNIYSPPISTYGDLKYAAGGEMAPKDVKDAFGYSEAEKELDAYIDKLKAKYGVDWMQKRTTEERQQQSRLAGRAIHSYGDAIPTPKNDDEYRKLGQEYNRLEGKGDRTKADEKRMLELEGALQRYEGSAEDAEYHGEAKTKRVKTAQEKANLLQVLSKMGIKPKIEKVPAGGFEITWTEPSEEERRNLDAY